jgi:membrane-bound lytic murein transglycosylase
MKKIVVTFLVGFALLSCKSVVFKENLFEEDADFDIQGNVKTITCYQTIKNEKTDSLKVILFYDTSKKLTKQIDHYKKTNDTTLFIYDNKNRLLEEKSTRNRGVYSNKYKYDTNGNLFSYQQLAKDEISFEIKYFYDKRNNVISEIHQEKNKPADTGYYEIDYKKRTRKLKNSGPNGLNANYYDKNGNNIKNVSTYGTIVYKYDKRNRMSKKTNYDKDGKKKFENIYLNKYDKFNNLIEIVVITDGKFYRRDTNIIEYY